MTESQLQRKIILEMERRGAYVRRISRTTRNGTPDLLCCHQGLFIAIEVKSPQGGRVSQLQRINQTQITKAGGASMIVNNLDTLKNWMDNERPKYQVIQIGEDE